MTAKTSTLASTLPQISSSTKYIEHALSSPDEMIIPPALDLPHALSIYHKFERESLSTLISILEKSSRAHKMPKLHGMSLSKVEKLIRTIHSAEPVDPDEEPFEGLDIRKPENLAIHVSFLAKELSKHKYTITPTVLNDHPPVVQAWRLLPRARLTLRIPLWVQIQIWKKILAKPRIIEFYTSASGNLHYVKDIQNMVNLIRNISNESRTWIEERYLKFHPSLIGIAPKPKNADSFLINFSQDIIWPNGHMTIRELLQPYRIPGEVRNPAVMFIQNLALEVKQFEYFLRTTRGFAVEWLGRLENLKQLSLFTEYNSEISLKGSSLMVTEREVSEGDHWEPWQYDVMRYWYNWLHDDEAQNIEMLRRMKLVFCWVQREETEELLSSVMRRLESKEDVMPEFPDVFDDCRDVLKYINGEYDDETDEDYVTSVEDTDRDDREDDTDEEMNWEETTG